MKKGNLRAKTILRPFVVVLRNNQNYLNKEQTLYLFTHTGVIEIFKRTSSLTKLQKAMGYSYINVSLTYLRGLEVAELIEKDMSTA